MVSSSGEGGAHWLLYRPTRERPASMKTPTVRGSVHLLGGEMPNVYE